jgi:ankyrin repeat protein
MLEGIDEEKWEYALRLFQCLAVARRPLRVKELAEVLAVELNAGGIPRLDVALRPRDADEAVLSACSTLVAIIQPDTPSFRLLHINHVRDNRVVQFSHYSVKEFLTSSRLQSSRQALSRFYISPGPAHTILAQSCISTLLQLDNSVKDDLRGFPLAEYTAHHWVDHGQVDGVSTQIRIGMESLFDPEKPHFNAWVDLQKTFSIVVRFNTPLCFAAFSGFHDVVKHLVTTRPQDTNAADPNSYPPLLAAQSGGCLRVMQFLLGQGADVECRNDQLMTPLVGAIRDMQHDVILLLLDQGADVNTRDAQHSTPLHEASERGPLDVVKQLIDLGADINAFDNQGATPLHEASRSRRLDIIRLLIERGADVNIRNAQHSTLLHKASERGQLDVVQQLIDLGADVNACDNRGATPLHDASLSSAYTRLAIIRLLNERGADVNTRDAQHSTPLHKASERGQLDVVQQLTDLGADLNASDNQGATPLHKASHAPQSIRLGVIWLLIERGADINTRDAQHSTP